MFEKYKDGDLITLKLMHGEEVISTLHSQTETTLQIKRALTLMQGPQGLASVSYTHLTLPTKA